jgi:uncharacterized protein YgbK (DUF1537 family)
VICAVIADDVTGACDSGVQFAAAGLRTVVSLSGVGDAPVTALSTDSRDIDRAESERRIRDAAGRLRARIVFKKIDSTLRGNTGVELVAALDAFGCDAAVVSPAFPEMGRVVEDGRLRVVSNPRFAPIELQSWLAAHGAMSAHVAPGSVARELNRGARWITFDANCQEDLVAFARETFSVARRIMWAGSAGMASALAGLIAAGGPAGLPVLCPGPALFCIGSDHPVTVEQQRRLVEQRDAVVLDVDGDVPAALQSHHVVLRIPRGYSGSMPRIRASALIVSGGDTAAHVCRSLEVESIDLRCEVARGIPAGLLRGGALDGAPIVTKSGGFGAPDDLILVADYFNA